jgi:hypothetical protein
MHTVSLRTAQSVSCLQTRVAYPCLLHPVQQQVCSSSSVCRRVQTVSNAASGAAGYPADPEEVQPLKPGSSETSAAAAGSGSAAVPQGKKTVWQKIKYFFVG